MSEPLDRLADTDAMNRRELLAQLLRAKARQASAVAPVPAAPKAIVPDPAAWGEPFPLNDLQSAYLFGRTSEVELGHNSIHVYAEFESRDLDLDRLDRSFRRLIDHHGMMRFVILPDGRQRILEEHPEYHVEVFDLRGEDLAAAEAEVLRQRERMSHQLFPVGQWPMFDVRACRLPDGRVTVHFSMDLIGADAHSLLLLFKDWGRFYAAPDAPVPPLELSYRDYVLAEIAFRGSEAAQPSRDYWLRRVPTLPSAPQLPMVKEPGEVARPRFRRRSFYLDPAGWGRLKERGQRIGLTPSMVLCAAFAEVLGAWSQSPRFCINAAVINRLALHPQVQDVLGVFSDLILLEVDTAAAETFEQRALRIQEQLWTDLDHRHFGGVRLLRELARHHGGLGARMPVVFTSTLLDFDLMAWLGESKVFVTQTPQVWLDYQIMVQGEKLSLHWDTIDELFPEGLLDAMFEAHSALLRRLADEEAAWTRPGRLPLPDAQAAVRAALNGRPAALPGVLAHHLFEAQAASHPGRLAVVAGGRSLTYGELDRAADALARRLRRAGVGPGALVGLVLEKGWEQVVAVLAVLKAGGAYLPVDAAVPAQRLAYCMENGGVRLALTQARLDARLVWPGDVERWAVDREEGTAGEAGTPPAAAQEPRELAYVLYTSGSTGEPKGVMISHEGILNCVAHTNERFGVGPGDRFLSLTPLHHDLSVYDLFGALAAGAVIVLPEPAGTRDPAHWADLMRRHGVTVWNTVPAMLEMLVEHAEGRPESLAPSLRLAILGGDWIPVTLPRRLRALVSGVQVVSSGGPTETTIWNILHPVADADCDRRSIPYGRPIPNASYHVLDAHLDDCPDWVQGEICCSGMTVSRGYWRDPARTASRFCPHPRTGERLYRTGDLGRYLPDGTLEFLGRADFQVKIEGVRIELGEIEAALLRHPEVRETVAAVTGRAVVGAGLRGRRRLVAYVVTKGGRRLQEAELAAFLRARLPEAMVPATFVQLDGLPLTANGKVDRRALPDPGEPRPAETAASAAAPQGDGLLERVSQLVAGVLELGSIAPDADLLDLGVSSIDMVRVANVLERELGFRPGVGEMFLLSTVRGLAGACEKHLAAAGAPATASAAAPARLLFDPREREEFKRRQLGLRQETNGHRLIQLAGPAEQDLAARHAIRRSHRAFTAEPLPAERFAELLGCLRQASLDGKPKYLYPSGGGLYPVQTYVWVRPGRVEGLRGAYYYHPVAHGLVELDSGLVIRHGVHAATNRALFDESAFSLFLVADLRAITPMYGEYSLSFATLEAGYMGQLLMTGAPAGVGLCPIGSLSFDSLRPAFELEEGHVLVHSLVGGLIDPARAGRGEGEEGEAGGPAGQEDREEGWI